MAFVLTILAGVIAGVIVSLITLWLAGLQRARAEMRAEVRRREAMLAAIGSELRWNRSATRGKLDVDNANAMVGSLATVAFERHGADLVSVVPDSVEQVFRHYALVGKARAGIRSMGGQTGVASDERLRRQWIEFCSEASVQVSNSATEALQSLALPLEA